ncbi:PAS-domain containing protein [Pseudovibrio exalbescens]|uniref:histidine kinase n=1 Tax=Pseudovibrio exalbescens TaxID=197461 RepID=A0A1U7JF05_9HYPH|nr:PAS-domain containing protein [Pseudovibrio exalbescens]OKL43285.1 hypothetical protein A3843_14300 [Pseudovibrio exalbescens]
MRSLGVQAKLLLILAVAGGAVLLAIAIAVWTMFALRGDVKQVTETELPKAASALRLARIGERLQRRGESLVVARNRNDRDTIQSLIGVDLAAMRSELIALRDVLPTDRSGEEAIVAYSTQLAEELTALRSGLERQTALEELLVDRREALLRREEQIQQALGPPLLAVSSILSRVNQPAPEQVTRFAVQNQGALIDTERHLKAAIVQILLTERATSPQNVRDRLNQYRRIMSQLEVAVSQLPSGLQQAVVVDLPFFRGQLAANGFFDIKFDVLRSLSLLQAFLESTRATADDLKRAVDQFIARDREAIAGATERITTSFAQQTLQYLIGSVLVVSLLILSAYLMYIRPLGQQIVGVSSAMRRLADGDGKVVPPGLDRTDEVGELARSFMVFKDAISQLEVMDKELAEQSRLMVATLDNMNDGFTVFDSDGNLLAFNPRFLDIYGLSAAFIEQGTPIKRIHMALARNGVRVFAANGQEVGFSSLRHDRGRLNKRYELHLPSGHVIELRSNPVPGGGFVTLHMDMTERVATQNRVWHARKIETISQLTTGVASELNTLLAVVLGNLRLLERSAGAVNPELKSRALSGIAAGVRAAHHVARLQAFSRKHKSEPGFVDPATVIEDLWHLLSYMVGPDIQLSVDCDEQPLGIHVDRGLLETAILNLAINAREAITGEGMLRISVSAAAHDKVLLEVQDSGKGMPTHILRALADPQASLRPAEHGVGFGLSMVYAFVAQAGGTIDITSEDGQGTEVRIWFDRVERPDMPARTDAQVPLGNGETVLVVDRDPALLEVNCALLEELGYKVLTATSGDAAMVLLGSHPEISMLYSEVELPAPWTGGKLAEAAIAQVPRLSAVLVSAEPWQRNTCNFRCLIKPVAVADLAAAFRDALGEPVTSQTARNS